MKRFVARLIAFTLLVAVVIGGVCLAEIAAEVRAYRRELVAPAQASALVCGDSQAGGDIDPEACPKFFNFSAHGRSLDQSYLAALDALDRNAGGGIKTVVFDVTPSAAARNRRTAKRITPTSCRGRSGARSAKASSPATCR